MNIEDHAKLAQDFGVGSVPAVVILKPDGQTSEKLTDTEQFLTQLKTAA